MRKQLTVVLSAAALLVSTTGIARSGAYLQGQFGIGGLDTPNEQLPGNYTYKTHKLRNGMTGRVALGYMEEKNELMSCGIEVGYSNYPKNKYRVNSAQQYEVNYQREDFDLLGVFEYKTNSNFNFFAKAGLAYAKETVKDSWISTTTTEKSERKYKPELAVGVGYNLTDQVGLNLTYSYTFGEKPDFDKAHNNNDVNELVKVAPVNSLLLGVRYSF